MANAFDQFDTSAESNPFDQFDVAVQAPAQAPSTPDSDRIGGVWGNVLDYFDLQKQAQAPEQRSAGAKALEAAGRAVSGLVPRTVEAGASLASPIVQGVETIYNAPRDIAQAYQNRNLPGQGPIYEAEQTPPWSQGRFNVGADIVAQMLMAKGLAGQVGGHAVTPNVDAAVRETMVQPETAQVQVPEPPRVNPIRSAQFEADAFSEAMRRVQNQREVIEPPAAPEVRYTPEQEPIPFGSEGTPVSSAIINDLGGILSKSGAIKSKKYAGNTALWDDLPQLSSPTHNKIYNSSGQMPDVAASELYDMGLIQEPTVDAMWRAVQSESRTSQLSRRKVGQQQAPPSEPIEPVGANMMAQLATERPEMPPDVASFIRRQKPLQPEPVDATIPTPDELTRQVAESPEAAPPGDIAPGQQPAQEAGAAGVGARPETGAGVEERGSAASIPPEDARYAGIESPENTAVPTTGEQPVDTAGASNDVGVAARYREEQQPGSVESGSVQDAEYWRGHGRDFINQGGDPEIAVRAAERGQVSPRNVGIVSAEYERRANLTQVAAQAVEDNPTPQNRAALDAATKAQAAWSRQMQPVFTRAGETLGATQGKLTVDESTFAGLYDKALEMNGGKDIPQPQQVEMLRRTQKVSRAKNAERQTYGRLDKAVPGRAPTDAEMAARVDDIARRLTPCQ